MEYSDHELVRGIKSGDKSALELLIRRWYPRVYGYVFKLTGHEQDAYDLTQDVFIAMMQSIGSYTPWRNLTAGCLRSRITSAWTTFAFDRKSFRRKIPCSTDPIRLPRLKIWQRSPCP